YGVNPVNWYSPRMRPPTALTAAATTSATTTLAVIRAPASAAGRVTWCGDYVVAMPERAERVELTGSSVRTEDWPAQATDSIVKVTGPITTVARAIVFGTFAAILGATAFVMFVVLLVRVVDNYLPDSVFGHEH